MNINECYGKLYKQDINCPSCQWKKYCKEAFELERKSHRWEEESIQAMEERSEIGEDHLFAIADDTQDLAGIIDNDPAAVDNRCRYTCDDLIKALSFVSGLDAITVDLLRVKSTANISHRVPAKYRNWLADKPELLQMISGGIAC